MATLSSAWSNKAASGTNGTFGTLAQPWRGGGGSVYVACTNFNGATIKLQYCPVNSATDAEWADVGANTAFTAGSNVGNFAILAGYLRLFSTAAIGAVAYWAVAGNGVGGSVRE